MVKLVLESLEDELEDEPTETLVNASDLTIELIQEKWDEYVSKVESDIIKQSLVSVDLSLNDNFLNIKVSSKLQQADIVKEKELMIFIRQALKVKDLQFDITVEQKPQDEKPVIKKNLTVKERYLQMRDLNPSINNLQKRFSLMPDE